jgi:hypothetical protein
MGRPTKNAWTNRPESSTGKGYAALYGTADKGTRTRFTNPYMPRQDARDRPMRADERALQAEPVEDARGDHGDEDV